MQPLRCVSPASRSRSTSRVRQHQPQGRASDAVFAAAERLPGLGVTEILALGEPQAGVAQERGDEDPEGRHGLGEVDRHRNPPQRIGFPAPRGRVGRQRSIQRIAMLVQALGEYRRAFHGGVHPLADGRHRMTGIAQERHPPGHEGRTTLGLAGR